MKLNKTTLYRFVREEFYPDIEPMKHTSYHKHYRAQSYELNFFVDDVNHTVTLFVADGRVMCSDRYDDEGVERWFCLDVPVEKIRTFGLL